MSELLKPLYEICDAGDYWGITLGTRVVNDLGMIVIPGDSAVYIRFGKSNVAEIKGVYVDDFLNAEDPSFERLAKNTNNVCDENPYL